MEIRKTWYEPFDDIDMVSLGLRFTAHLPAHAMIPPGQWELFKMAVELAQSGVLTPLERERARDSSSHCAGKRADLY